MNRLCNISGRIRISCAALCRIAIDGRYLLEINKNRGNVLTPIGGALECSKVTQSFLLKIGAEHQEGNDLRLVLPAERLTRFDDWFRTREERETSPIRELREELLKEHGLSISVGCLDLSHVKFLGCVVMDEESSRKGMQGVLTHYYFEIFQVGLAAGASDAIRRAMQDGNAPRLRLVTRDEVDAGRNSEGLPIGRNARSLFTSD